MNLLDMLKDQVSGPLAGQASKFLGESESSISKALDGIFPSVLDSTVKSANTEDGASKLLDMVKGMDTKGMDDISGIFSGGASGVSKLMNQGSGVMNMLMGNRVGGLIDTISKFSGLGGSSSSSLLKMAAPFLMRMIGKQVSSKGLGAKGLMDLLSSQKSHISSAMPAGFASGITGKATDSVSKTANTTVDTGKKVVSGTVDTGKKVVSGTVDTGKRAVSGAANVAGDVSGTAAKTGGGLLKWLLPIILVLGALSFFGIRGCGPVDNVVDATKGAAGTMVDKAGDVAGDAAGAVGDVAGKAAGAVEDAAGAVGDVAGKAAGAVGDAAGSVGGAIGGAFGKIDEAAKAGLSKIKFAGGSAGSQMMEFIDGGFKGDGKFTFKNLNFASGSATIDAKTAAEIDNVASILKAYPDVKVVVNGYTDNVGDAAANVKLSQARADAVKARLMGKNGIDVSRISTKGHGAANPRADNSTKEGQAKNRRIEMQIVK